MGPLAGLKVVELAGIGPGPHCAMLFSDMGAEVVRVDRTLPSGLGVPRPYGSDLLNRGRRSVAIDMKNPDGVATLLRLAEQADALIEPFRPGVAERLGIGPDACLARNPRLVYGRMTGWGQTGPLAHAAGTTSTTSPSRARCTASASGAARRSRRSTWWAISAAAPSTSPTACSPPSSRPGARVRAKWWTSPWSRGPPPS